MWTDRACIHRVVARRSHEWVSSKTSSRPGEPSVIALNPDTGDVAEVLLRIEGQPLLLVAGELYEERDGRLLYVRDDESVLVFTDPAIADTIPWSPPRPATSELTWQ